MKIKELKRDVGFTIRKNDYKKFKGTSNIVPLTLMKEYYNIINIEGIVIYYLLDSMYQFGIRDITIHDFLFIVEKSRNITRITTKQDVDDLFDYLVKYM